MKRIIYLFLILPIFLFSCESIPKAAFSTDTVEPEVGEKVFFNNHSDNAVKFEWDFGDGSVTTVENPDHIFTGTGSFEVTLTAVSKSGLSDKATLTLDVKIPTLLEIEVREYFDQYTVSNASVILYPTLPDWDAQTKSVTEGFTDKDGIVVFSNLDPWVYYVDVLEKNHDNYTLRDEDVGFIRTPEVLPHKINRFVAWVDYVGSRKGDGRAGRTMVIKKLERKASDRSQLVVVSDTENWQEVFARRVVKK
jgi:PKD repeat protein